MRHNEINGSKVLYFVFVYGLSTGRKSLFIDNARLRVRKADSLLVPWLRLDAKSMNYRDVYCALDSMLDRGFSDFLCFLKVWIFVEIATWKDICYMTKRCRFYYIYCKSVHRPITCFRLCEKHVHYFIYSTTSYIQSGAQWSQQRITLSPLFLIFSTILIIFWRAILRVLVS